MKKLKFELVHNWRSGWKWVSTQCMVLAGAILSFWPLIPDDMKRELPPGIVRYVAIVVLAVGVAGRFIKQEKPPCP
jgi:hypothetical protein